VTQNALFITQSTNLTECYSINIIPAQINDTVQLRYYLYEMSQ